VLPSVQRFDSNSSFINKCNIDQEDELLDLYDLARLIQEKSSDSAIQAAARGVMEAIQDDPVQRLIIYNAFNSAKIPSDSDCSGKTWKLDNSHGIAGFWPKPDARRSFYTGANTAYAAGTDWGSGQASSSQANQEIIQWGPMLVEYVNAVYPQAVDDPSLPPLIEPGPDPRWKVYLPLSVK
jgi:hypothetical protein